jgi:hypothetical protein
MDGTDVTGVVDLVTDEFSHRLGHEHVSLPRLYGDVPTQGTRQFPCPGTGSVYDPLAYRDSARAREERSNDAFRVTLRTQYLGSPQQLASGGAERPSLERDGQHRLDLAILRVKGATSKGRG